MDEHYILGKVATLLVISSCFVVQKLGETTGHLRMAKDLIWLTSDSKYELLGFWSLPS